MVRLDASARRAAQSSFDLEVTMLAVLFVVIAIAVRFLLLALPHMWLNLTPVGAALLFFGARGPKRLAWLPLVAFIAADVYMTRARYGYPLTADAFVTWAWYAGMIGLGMLLRRNQSPLRIFGASLAAAVSFFLVSNFAVWMVWDMYPKTVNGLMLCYAAAIPFFRNELVSDVLFTAVLFSVPAVIAALKPAAARQAA